VKILFVNQKCGFFGGVEQNVADTAVGLRAAGHRCVLAYGETTDIRSDDYAGIFDAHVACHELGEITDADSLREIVTREDPNIIYLHKVPDIRRLLPILHGRHTVMMVHDHDLCCPRRHKYSVWTGRVCHQPMGVACYLDAANIARGPHGVQWVSLREKAEVMRAHRVLDLLLVGSTFMRDELLCNGFAASQVRILAPQVQRHARAVSPVPHQGGILYVGQLIRGKGVDLLLEAFARHVPEGQLRIVGAGNAATRLHTQARNLGLQDRVQFLGWVNHDELDVLYQSAQVVVVPSRWPEPFGMVGLEAMSHARPIVAFAVGGITDWLHDGENGIAVPEQDIAAFGNAIQRLLRDNTLSCRLGEQGYQRFRAEYTFTNYIQVLHDLFSALSASSSTL